MLMRVELVCWKLVFLLTRMLCSSLECSNILSSLMHNFIQAMRSKAQTAHIYIHCEKVFNLPILTSDKDASSCIGVSFCPLTIGHTWATGEMSKISKAKRATHKRERERESREKRREERWEELESNVYENWGCDSAVDLLFCSVVCVVCVCGVLTQSKSSSQSLSQLYWMLFCFEQCSRLDWIRWREREENLLHVHNTECRSLWPLDWHTERQLLCWQC